MYYTRSKERLVPRLTKEFHLPSRVRSEFVEDCDINVILDRFTKTGVLEHQAKYAGRYGDFLDAPQSLQEAKNQVRAAEEMFMTLPAKVREAYQNSPQVFLEAVDDAEQGDALAQDKLKALGVLSPKKSPPPAERSPTAPKEEPAPSKEPQVPTSSNQKG